jgi:hypothetical protein
LLSLPNDIEYQQPVPDANIQYRHNSLERGSFLQMVFVDRRAPVRVISLRRRSQMVKIKGNWVRVQSIAAYKRRLTVGRQQISVGPHSTSVATGDQQSSHLIDLLDATWVELLSVRAINGRSSARHAAHRCETLQQTLPLAVVGIGAPSEQLCYRRWYRGTALLMAADIDGIFICAPNKTNRPRR